MPIALMVAMTFTIIVNDRTAIPAADHTIPFGLSMDIDGD
jgi:hypothetical protein